MIVKKMGVQMMKLHLFINLLNYFCRYGTSMMICIYEGAGFATPSFTLYSSIYCKYIIIDQSEKVEQ